MTSMNPSMPSTRSLGSLPTYSQHDNQQLTGLDQGGSGNDGALGNTAGAGGFRSIGDYATSGNYTGGSGNTDEPIDIKQARFNNSPYLRRPFGPQEMM